MSEPDMALLRSPTAIVARREVVTDSGGGVIHCVVLADGFLIECGSGFHAERRAHLLAEAVNAAGPDKFNFRK